MNDHLAQINIGRLIAPLDDPKIAEFVATSTLSMRSRTRLRDSCGGSSQSPATPPTLPTTMTLL